MRYGGSGTDALRWFADGGDELATWVWITHAASPEELQAHANAFLGALHTHGGEVLGVNYSAMARDAVGPKAFFSLCVTYRGDQPPDELLATTKAVVR